MKTEMRAATEVLNALKAVQAELDHHDSMERTRWRDAYERDQQAAADRGETFWLGKTGPALEEFERSDALKRAVLSTRVQVLKWVLGKEEK